MTSQSLFCFFLLSTNLSYTQKVFNLIIMFSFVHNVILTDIKIKFMANKYFDENGNSLYPDEYNKEDRDEGVLSQKIKKEKDTNTRPIPSNKFIDEGSNLSPSKRKNIIDIAGKYCDEAEDLFYSSGRCLLCLQFAILVKYILKKEGLNSKIYSGKVKYLNVEHKIDFTWEHFWVELDNDLIDCNIDSIIDNHLVPAYLEPSNFWGPINSVPNDRVFLTRKEFSDIEEKQLEIEDTETIEWKKRIDIEYLITIN
jgi:hypothetical protein